ncbi:hypothetical protein Hanom_Chr05g00472871 [Helianthus anomalus]
MNKTLFGSSTALVTFYAVIRASTNAYKHVTSNVTSDFIHPSKTLVFSTTLPPFSNTLFIIYNFCKLTNNVFLLAVRGRL